jgi:CheY-like chemotaxis protein
VVGHQVPPQHREVFATTDVIVTDDLMPNQLTGRELARLISTANPRIRTIVLTGNPSAEEMEGGPPVLQKPVRLADLAQAIRNALYQNRTQGGDPLRST